MKILGSTTDADSESELARYFDAAHQAARRVLFLDYDGTLAPFTPRRDRAIPYPGVRNELDALIEQARSRLVIVSGRVVEDLIPLLGLKRVPEIWGAHGWQRLTPGESVARIGEIDQAARDALSRAKVWAEERGWSEHCETKPGCLALHWRGLNRTRQRTMRDRAAEAWRKIASEHGLQLNEFDGGLELRVSGWNKGRVVETVLDEEPSDAAVAYLGDDLTDEDGFAALEGRGLGVLVRAELRKTRADLWIRPPEELLEFLRRWRQACAD